MFCFKKKPLTVEQLIKRSQRYSPFEQEKFDEIVLRIYADKKQATPKRFGLRLIVISDTHGHLAYGPERFPDFMSGIPQYDLCILLGDVSPYDIDEIVKIIPKEKIIAVKGNHDLFDVYEGFEIEEISGKVIERCGVKFAGIEGSFRYKNKAFPSFTQYESLALAEKIPPCDVLLTHDSMFVHSRNDAAHAGLAGITYYVYKNAPTAHIQGHLHKSFEKVYDNGTLHKCVYLCEYVEI